APWRARHGCSRSGQAFGKTSPSTAPSSRSTWCPQSASVMALRRHTSRALPLRSWYEGIAMTPDQLTAASFASYPPQARQFATAHLALLQQLPIAVAPAFLREIIVFDWRFPAERHTFERQCVWLESLTPEQRARLLAPFRQISMPASFAAKDWVGAPQPFL